MFSGSITDLITPMSDGELDLDAFTDLVEWQIEQGCHGLAVAGMTGETSTLTMTELPLLVQRCLDIAAGNVPVLAGVSAFTPADAIDRIRSLPTLGLSAVLLALPEGSALTKDGLYQFLRLVHDETELPLIVDLKTSGPTNGPTDLSALLRLSDLPRVIGFCDSGDDITRSMMLRLGLGKPFTILGRFDTQAAGFLAQGGHGCLSAMANCVPNLCARLHTAWQDQDMDTFEDLRDLLFPLGVALSRDEACVTVKYALQRLGFCSDDVRLPRIPAAASVRQDIDMALARLGENAALSPDIAA